MKITRSTVGMIYEGFLITMLYRSEANYLSATREEEDYHAGRRGEGAEFL